MSVGVELDNGAETGQTWKRTNGQTPLPGTIDRTAGRTPSRTDASMDVTFHKDVTKWQRITGKDGHKHEHTCLGVQAQVLPPRHSWSPAATASSPSRTPAGCLASTQRRTDLFASHQQPGASQAAALGFSIATPHSARRVFLNARHVYSPLSELYHRLAMARSA